MQYFTQISMAMMALSRMFVMYTKCSASARRISEVLNAPEDLVVQNGSITEQGSHDELMERGGFYATLYNSQFA